MVECIASWMLLIVAIISRKAEWYIASGVFAVATNLCRIIDKMDGGHNNGC